MQFGLFVKELELAEVFLDEFVFDGFRVMVGEFDFFELFSDEFICVSEDGVGVLFCEFGCDFVEVDVGDFAMGEGAVEF